MKALKIVLGLVVALIAVALVVVILKFDDIIKTVVETVGSDVTQVAVTLNKVDSDLSSGRIELHKLSIANPKGFDGAYLFDMEQIALQVDPASIASGNTIVVNEVLIDGAKIAAELKGQTTNLQALQKNIEASTKSASKPSSSQTAESESRSASETRLLAVEKFSFINSNLHLSSDQWGDRDVTMPNIVMENLGSAKAGLTPEQLSQEVISRLTKAVQKAVEKELKGAAEEAAKERLNKEMDERLSDKDKETVNQLKGLFGK